MAFITGLGFPNGIGLPSYYVPAGNIWDANTYVSIIFDSSGSMDNIITPITNAMGGDYFSSGSASGEDGVKSTTSIRALVQDIYASGGIEGHPDWNTDNATNGKTEFEKHVQFLSDDDERSALHLSKPLKYNASATWPASPTVTTFADSAFVTPSNFIMIAVCNESQDDYHDGGQGSTWANDEITTNWKADISALRNAVGVDGLNANGVTQANAIADRADGYKPSYTGIVIDPGRHSSYHNVEDLTASQLLWRDGAVAGQGSYALNAVTSGYTYSLSDFEDLTSWNARQNKIHLSLLYEKVNATSLSYWKNQLLQALLTNISLA